MHHVITARVVSASAIISKNSFSQSGPAVLLHWSNVVQRARPRVKQQTNHLSFGVILITWVNHHGALKLIRRSRASFIYANGICC